MIEMLERHRKEVPTLTKRERDVLRFIAKGKTSQEIGMILSISARTAEWHTLQLMRKLDVTSRAQAVLVAIASNVALGYLFVHGARAAARHISQAHQLTSLFT